MANVIGLLKVLAGVAALGAFASSGSEKKPGPKTSPPKDDGKLGPYIYVERTIGQAADAPVLLLLHDNGSRAEDVLALLDGMATPARVFALVGDQFAAGGHAFVDVTAADQVQAQLDASVRLSAAAADALFKFSPKRRIVVAGVGQSGTLAVLLALFGGVAVRLGLGAGGYLSPKQIPQVAGADAPARLLTWGGMGLTVEAAKLAIERKLQLELVELDGDPTPAALGAWLREQLATALP